MKIRAKFMMTISAILILGGTLMLAWGYYASHKSAVRQAIQDDNTLSGTIHEAVYGFMRTGQQEYLDGYLEKARRFESVSEIRVIRAPSLEKEMGIKSTTRVKDDLDRQVLQTGQTIDRELTLAQGRAIRHVSPILLDSTCLVCHPGFKEGEVIAALSTTLSFQSSLDRNVRSLMQAGLIQILIILLVAVAIFSLFNRFIMDPVAQIGAFVKKLGGGDLAAKISLRSSGKTQTSAAKDPEAKLDPQDELGGLAIAFNKMSRDLQETIVTRDDLLKEVELRKKLEQSIQGRELFLASLTDAIPNPVFYKDRHGVYLGCNRAFETFLGISKEKLTGKTDEDIFPPDVAAFSREKEKKLLDSSGMVFYQMVLKNANGQPRNVIFNEATFLDPAQGVSRLVGVIIDVTEQKRLDRALQESEKRFMDVLYASKDAILLIDGDKFVDCNEATARMLGYATRQEFLMTHPSELSPPTQPDGQSSFEKANRMMNIAFTEGFNRFERIHKKANGENFPVEVSLTPIAIRGKNILHCLWRDETEVKKAEEALRQSEEKMRSITDSAQDAILMMDPQGMISFWNPSAERILGYRAEEALGMNLHQLLAPTRFHVAHHAAFPGFLKTGQGAAVGKTLELVAARKDGVEIPVELSLSAIQRGDGWHAVGIMRDISEKKIDRSLLEERAKETREALKESLLAQEALLRMLQDNREVKEKLEQSMGEVRKNQQMLLQSEKLASIGQLAAGIAHEINNPTGFIGSNIATLDTYMADITKIFRVMEALKAAVKEGDIGKAQKVEKEVEELERETDVSYIFSDVDNLLRESKEGVVRIANIVRDLKLFSHTQEDVFIPSELCKIIDGVINIVWSELKYKADLKKDYAPDLLVNCNPQQIGQVLINILVNAAQAIEGKGAITIKTYAAEGFAIIVITDTGCGIPQENLSKIFDPFFTTKAPGKGTGLGLGISAAIIKKHGGYIKAESEPGKGTTFTISLPMNTTKGVS